ncbi:MAG TPA: methylenetetrahydrofolate reductase [Spirochaetota bacterium]|nr:methylenetetrahydrofolate reductase [Spirochaetota bacterium]HPJ35857.1 methylenetetrahydrofolate reductase [Spirochaetota bacterium]
MRNEDKVTMDDIMTLRDKLASGKFVVTGELGPPRGCDAEAVRKKARMLKGAVDAVNITDNQTAIVRMSSLAASMICMSEGIEPVMQMTVRDRNRIALQSDLLGAAALGIKNVLCLSGDHQSFGDQPGAKGVHDIDSIQLVYTARRLCEEKMILHSEKAFAVAPDLFIGAACNPFAEPVDFRPVRLKMKIEAGAKFIQTQSIYDIPAFREFMKRIVDMGLHEKASIIAGVMPLKSAGMGTYLNEKVPGVVVPKHMIERIKGVPKERAADEGIEQCCEIINEIRGIEGVSGVHIMAIEWEHRVREIAERAGLI